jgi:hypothetical protein
MQSAGPPGQQSTVARGLANAAAENFGARHILKFTTLGTVTVSATTIYTAPTTGVWQ